MLRRLGPRDWAALAPPALTIATAKAIGTTAVSQIAIITNPKATTGEDHPHQRPFLHKQEWGMHDQGPPTLHST